MKPAGYPNSPRSDTSHEANLRPELVGRTMTQNLKLALNPKSSGTSFANGWRPNPKP